MVEDYVVLVGKLFTIIAIVIIVSPNGTCPLQLYSQLLPFDPLFVSADNSENPSLQVWQTGTNMSWDLSTTDWNTEHSFYIPNLYNESRKKFTGSSIHARILTLPQLARDVLSLVHCPTGTILQSELWWRAVRSHHPHSPSFSSQQPSRIIWLVDFDKHCTAAADGWHVKEWPQDERRSSRRLRSETEMEIIYLIKYSHNFSALYAGGWEKCGQPRQFRCCLVTVETWYGRWLLGPI